MFNFIKEKLQKIYQSVTTQIHTIFSKPTIDQTTIDQLYKLLIQADTGVTTTKSIIARIQDAYQKNSNISGGQIQSLIQQQLLSIVAHNTIPSGQVYLLVGINGSGKTTLSGKLAYLFAQQGKTVLLAGADTFRAAAAAQLAVWAKKSNTTIINAKPGQDPAAVAFDACAQYKKNGTDILIIDTAGRLQTKENLMKELEKIKRIIQTQLPHYQICTLLTIDAMLGQNSFSQAKIFNEVTKLDGIVLTKMDSTAKGGIVFSIVQELNLPVAYISWGEQIDDIAPFNAEMYVNHLLGIASLPIHQKS